MRGLTTERLQEVMFGMILLVSVAAGITALEFAYRVYTAASYPNRVDWDAMVASIGIPDHTSQQPRFQPGTTFGIIHFNSLGLRGPEPAVPAPDNVVRIAFVGDSKVMSANYPEHQTLSAQTIRALEALVPQCDFDYITIAGPDYDIALLANIWTEVAPKAKPDLAVIMVSSIEHLFRDPQGSNKPLEDATAKPTWIDTALDRLQLLRAVQGKIADVGSALAPSRSVDLDLARLSKAYERDLKPLIAAVDTTSVLALGYRSRLRAGQPPSAQARYSRNLRLALPGLGVPDALELSEFNVAELARQADAAGWNFADPGADMPTDDAYFVDDSHFSEIGLSYLSQRIAPMIAPAVKPGCVIDLNTAKRS